MLHKPNSRGGRPHGSLLAIVVLIAGCGSQSSAAPNEAQGNAATHQAATTTAAPVAAQPSASAQDHAAIMGVAGFTNPRSNSRWTWRDPEDAENTCGQVTAAIFGEVRDLNGDGQPDAVVTAEDVDGDECITSRMTPYHTVLLTRAGATWRIVATLSDHPRAFRYHARQGIAWPDIEIIYPRQGESGCSDFLRWNGREYVAGGSSQQGRICTLTPEARAIGGAMTQSDADSVPAPVAPFNIRPGHYVPVAAPCGTPSEMIFYYDGRLAGWIDNLPFNPNHMNPVAGARRRSADWLIDPAMGETLRVQAMDEIAVGDPDTGVETMRWCPANEVRASARAR